MDNDYLTFKSGKFEQLSEVSRNKYFENYETYTDNEIKAASDTLTTIKKYKTMLTKEGISAKDIARLNRDIKNLLGSLSDGRVWLEKYKIFINKYLIKKEASQAIDYIGGKVASMVPLFAEVKATQNLVKDRVAYKGFEKDLDKFIKEFIKLQ